jgi:hypothetical protein
LDAQWAKEIEQEISLIKTRLAVAERDISVILAKLDKIDSNTTWLLRLIVGGACLAFLTFMIKGGLNI